MRRGAPPTGPAVPRAWRRRAGWVQGHIGGSGTSSPSLDEKQQWSTRNKKRPLTAHRIRQLGFRADERGARPPLRRHASRRPGRGETARRAALPESSYTPLETRRKQHGNGAVMRGTMTASHRGSQHGRSHSSRLPRNRRTPRHGTASLSSTEMLLTRTYNVI